MKFNDGDKIVCVDVSATAYYGKVGTIIEAAFPSSFIDADGDRSAYWIKWENGKSHYMWYDQIELVDQ